jgi:hypothetical protein
MSRRGSAASQFAIGMYGACSVAETTPSTSSSCAQRTTPLGRRSAASGRWVEEFRCSYLERRRAAIVDIVVILELEHQHAPRLATEKGMGRPASVPSCASLSPAAVKDRVRAPLKRTYNRRRRVLFPDVDGFREGLPRGHSTDASDPRHSTASRRPVDVRARGLRLHGRTSDRCATALVSAVSIAMVASQ